MEVQVKSCVSVHLITGTHRKIQPILDNGVGFVRHYQFFWIVLLFGGVLSWFRWH